MKLHFSAIERLIRIYDNYGGHRNEQKLKNALAELDFTSYDKQSSGETILVMTEDYQRETGQVPGR